MGIAYGTQDEVTNKGHKDHPLIGQMIGEDPPYAVTQRAQLFERAQKMGLIPTFLPNVEDQLTGAPYAGAPVAGKYFNAFGYGGPEETPPEAPELPPDPSNQPPGDANQNNPYGIGYI